MMVSATGEEDTICWYVDRPTLALLERYSAKLQSEIRRHTQGFSTLAYLHREQFALPLRLLTLRRRRLLRLPALRFNSTTFEFRFLDLCSSSLNFHFGRY